MYHYRVRAYNAAGVSNHSNTIVAKTGPLPTYSLSVNKVGLGTVSSLPAGINCGASCIANFSSGTTVTLVATPARGYLFSGWSGACSGSDSCTVDMTTARTVTATFQVATSRRISDVIKAEGHAGTTDAILTVALSAPSDGTVTVNYATADGSARAGSDYIATSGRLTFAPGQTRQTVTVKLIGDTVPEANETFVVNLSAASGSTIVDGRGVGTILNDDGPVLRINAVSTAEGNTGITAANFTVTLSPASTSIVTVKYATANSTARAGSDYVASSGTLIFAPGETSKMVLVNIIGDRTKEAVETFRVNLNAATGATLFDAQGVGTIRNDD